MIYLYAVIDQPSAPIPAISGLDGVVIEVLPYRDVGAVISGSMTSDVQPTEANLWRHEAVLEELMADHAILPARFGTVFADEAEVLAALETHYDEFIRADLNRVRGYVELGLRVLWDDALIGTPDNPPPASSGGGRAYMLARVEEERALETRRQQAEASAAKIHGPLSCLAEESTCRLLVDPSPYLTAAYLVKHERVAAFRREVESLGATHPELRLVCTGPWPPFNFVTGKPIENRKGNEKW